MDNEKLSHAQVKNILRDLDSQIQGLQYRIREIVGQFPSHAFIINTKLLTKKFTTEELVKMMRQMPIVITKIDDDETPIKEIDRRIDVEYVTGLLIELRKLQDQHYELTKVTNFNINH